MKIFIVFKKEVEMDFYIEELLVLDNGYFDVFVAIGYVVLVDVYYEGLFLLISFFLMGFKVIYVLE